MTSHTAPTTHQRLPRWLRQPKRTASRIARAAAAVALVVVSIATTGCAKDESHYAALTDDLRRRVELIPDAEIDKVEWTHVPPVAQYHIAVELNLPTDGEPEARVAMDSAYRAIVETATAFEITRNASIKVITRGPSEAGYFDSYKLGYPGGLTELLELHAAGEPLAQPSGGPTPDETPGAASPGADPVSGGTPSALPGDGGGAHPDGSFSSPYPIGTEFVTPEWRVTIKGVNLDATEQIAATSYPDGGPGLPDEGNRYVSVSYTALYTGSDPQGRFPQVAIAFVSPDGASYGLNGGDSYLHGMDLGAPVLPGMMTICNLYIEVPVSGIDGGVFALSADAGMEIVFVASA